MRLNMADVCIETVQDLWGLYHTFASLLYPNSLSNPNTVEHTHSILRRVSMSGVWISQITRESKVDSTYQNFS